MLRLAAVVGAAALLPARALGAVIRRTVTTPTYKLTLSVGPVEKMYTAAEVKAKHPTDGEVMVGPSMSMGGMSMSDANRHLEVHVTARASGKVVTNAKPAITLTDTTGMAMAEKVDAMAMQGIGEGGADLHYGDNVTLTTGHTYQVLVKVKGEKATFTFKA